MLYSLDWDAGWDLRRAPQIAPPELERRIGLKWSARWSERGQWIAVYARAELAIQPVRD